jgi:hypothetical protein
MAKEDQNLQAALTVELQSLYETNKVHPHDLFWYNGQACIAYCEKVQRWFRGIIEKVNTKECCCEVLFIDVGLIDDVCFENLRKDISPNLYKK